MRTFVCVASVLVWFGSVDTPRAVAQEGLSSSSPQTTLQLAPFHSIEAHNGVHLVVRPGSAHRATLLRGSIEYSRVAVTAGGELVIDRCVRKCPPGYRLEVEVVAPALDRISLSHGGTIESRGSFPRQDELTLAVSNGGTIDARSLIAESITASVSQGGRILTAPQATLVATVTQGGIITYWGDARVRSSVQHGGVVTRADAPRVDLHR